MYVCAFVLASLHLIIVYESDAVYEIRMYNMLAKNPLI